MTDALRTLPEIAGFDFKISATSCSGSGADVAVSVRISRRERNEKILLFQYHHYDIDPLPEITQVGPHAVRVSVLRIVEPHDHRDTWQGLAVACAIGDIHFPTSPALGSPR